MYSFYCCYKGSQALQQHGIRCGIQTCTRLLFSSLLHTLLINANLNYQFLKSMFLPPLSVSDTIQQQEILTTILLFFIKLNRSLIFHFSLQEKGFPPPVFKSKKFASLVFCQMVAILPKKNRCRKGSTSLESEMYKVRHFCFYFLEIVNPSV